MKCSAQKSSLYNFWETSEWYHFFWLIVILNFEWVQKWLEYIFKVWESIIEETFLCLEIFCISYATCPTNIALSPFKCFHGSNVRPCKRAPIGFLNSHFCELVRKAEEKPPVFPIVINISYHTIKLRQCEDVLGTLRGHFRHFCLTCQVRSGD